MGVPSILVPFPAAVDDHQRHNAEAFVRAGAARCVAQRDAQPRVMCDVLGDLLEAGPARTQMAAAAARLHRPDSADVIAERLLGLAAGPFSARADDFRAIPVVQESRRSMTTAAVQNASTP
jgi:UDP-N-acetylglucosamine--N-acetylmuramyl-(pentapeptide) pyrophosphoryl-undecaprenol N-acetylglucosamine transferase